jgi:hypothetical protein
MILRRLMEHLREQHWTGVLIELVIVILGVFIGLQASNWNEYAGERRTEAEYLAQLRHDLQNIQAEVETQVAFEHFQAELAGRVYDLIENDYSPDRALKINIGLSELTVRRTLKAESPTFLDLQGSGKLGIISDPELRSAIISYFYASSRLEAAVDKNNATFVDHGFNDFIRSNNVPYREWDASLMDSTLPESARVNAEDADQKALARLNRAGGAFLVAPPQAELWDEVVPQLSWRGRIATANVSLTRRLLASTLELEARLTQFRERAR